MVGIFSRFTPTGHHRHSRPAGRSVSSALLDEKDNTSIVKEPQAPTVNIHGGQVADEFAPVEHPVEPPEKDQPVRCPPPEPCIVHDGRLWKERLQMSTKRWNELPFMRESGLESARMSRHTSSDHSIQPSMSAPAITIINLLDS